MKLTKTTLRELIIETLNEEKEKELNELLQEISALKSAMGRLRGGKKFKKGYGWEAAIEQWDEEDAQKAAQSLGAAGVDSKEDFKAKVQDAIKKAESSGDPRAKKAIEDLTDKIEKSAVEQEKFATDCPSGANYSPQQQDADGNMLPCPGPQARQGREWQQYHGKVRRRKLPDLIAHVEKNLAKMDVQLTDKENAALKQLFTRAVSRRK